MEQPISNEKGISRWHQQVTLKKTGKEKQFIYLETGGEETVARARNSEEGHQGCLCAATKSEDACAIFQETLLDPSPSAASLCHPVGR